MVYIQLLIESLGRFRASGQGQESSCHKEQVDLLPNCLNLRTYFVNIFQQGGFVASHNLDLMGYGMQLGLGAAILVLIAPNKINPR
jgi:hypothetical protein